jgi:YD repeat-containing protein
MIQGAGMVTPNCNKTRFLLADVPTTSARCRRKLSRLDILHSSPTMPARRMAILAALLVLALGGTAAAQSSTYHLHIEPSTTPALAELKAAGPDAAAAALQSIDLKNLNPTPVVIKYFDTQAGVPGTPGTLPSGSVVTFTYWMKKTALGGTITMYPQASLRVNADTGALVCTATGTSALTTTLTKFIFSCTSSAAVALTATDRWWISAGVNMTAGPGNKSVKAEIDIEGTLNGNYDSYLTIPAVIPPAPVLSDMSPVVGPVATAVTLTGANFGVSQGSSTVKFFNGITATPSSWSATSVIVPVPVGAATGPVTVTTAGGTSNTLAFTVSSSGNLSGTITRATGGQAISGAVVDVMQSGIIRATRTTPANGTYSVTALTSGQYDIRITASGFITQLQASVTVGGGATTVVNAALAPPGTISGRVTESAGGTGIAGASITATTASGASSSTTADANGDYSLTGLAPGSYTVEASGIGFAPQTQAGVAVTESSVTTANFSLATTSTPTVRYVYDELSRLTAVVDTSGDTARYVYDAVGNVTSIVRHSSSGLALLEFSPNRGPVGTVVTLTGSGFSAAPSENTVTFGGTPATVSGSTPTSIQVTVPAGASTGVIGVTVGGLSTNSGTNFSVTTTSSAPTITGFSPSIGAPGTSVTLNGTNFSSTLASNIPFFNVSRAAVRSATTTQVGSEVPLLGTSGRLTIATAYGTALSAADFFVPQSPYTAADVDQTARLTYGQPFNVVNATTTRLQMLVFDATAGQRVSVQYSNITDGSRGFSLRSPDATFMIPYQSGGTFLDSLIMPRDGTYTLTFLPGSIGGRTVTLHSAADVMGTITPGGDPVPVTINTPGQNVRLTFSGTSGARVAVTVPAGMTIAQADVSILKPDGTLLAPSIYADSTYGGFLDAEALPVNGQYTVLLNPRDAYIGNATITLHDAADATGTISANGVAVPAPTTVPGQRARLAFTGTANQRVSLKISGATYPSGFSCGAVVSIRGVDDAALASHSCVIFTDAFIDTVTLLATGSHSVLVDPAANYTGTVNLTLYDVPEDASAVATINGGGVIVTTNTAGQNAQVTFAANGGEVVTISGTGSSMGCTSVRLLRPDSSEQASTSPCGATFTFSNQSLTTPGTYTVSINPNGMNKGSVTVAVTQ